MKKQTSNISNLARAFVASLFTLLLLFTTTDVKAQTPLSESFIGSGSEGTSIQSFNGYVAFVAQTTNVYGASMIYAKGTLVTNVTITITNPVNQLVITGYQSAFYPKWVTNTSWAQDCGLWANADGSIANCAIAVDINGNGYWATNGTGGNQGNGAFTNTVQFNFAAEGVGVGIFGNPGSSGYASTGPWMGGQTPANQPQNTWSFTMVGNGTNDVVLLTNVPTSFLQGAKAIRLSSFYSLGANAGTNGQVVYCCLVGYAPNGGAVAIRTPLTPDFASQLAMAERASLADPSGKFVYNISASKLAGVEYVQYKNGRWATVSRDWKVFHFGKRGESLTQLLAANTQPRGRNHAL